MAPVSSSTFFVFKICLLSPSALTAVAVTMFSCDAVSTKEELFKNK